MGSITPILPSLNAGEVTPWLEGRVDFAQYPKALRKCVNFMPLVQGPLTKRSGTKFVANARTAGKKSRLIPFIKDDNNAYILEFSDGYIRFFTNRAQVVSGMAAYEIASPYLEADLPLLNYVQSVDVLFLAHPDYAPRKLSHTDSTNWTLETIEFSNGPYLPEDTEGTTLTPANYGSVSRVMTSNTTPGSDVIADDAGSADPWKAFDLNETASYSKAAGNGYIQITFGSSATKKADAYWLRANKSSPERMPSNWRFEGRNGGAWLTLDSRKNENGWGAGEIRYYSFVNDTAYNQYRLRWLGVDDDGGNTTLNELAIHHKRDEQTAFNLTASATTGINGGSGFLSTDVGRSVRLYGSDGFWRDAIIIAYTSSTVVTIRLDGFSLPDLDPITRWQLGAWSAYDGYPATVTFYNDRLFWGATYTQPQTIWGSIVGDYYNHAPGTEDDAALNLTLSSSDNNVIKWMEGDEKGLIIGASRGEWIVRGGGNGEPLTPTSAIASRVSGFGSAAVQRQRVGSAVVFVQRGARKLREMAYVIEADGYRAPDMTVRAEHITAPGITDLAYQSQPTSVMWAVRSDGTLLGFTYERDQEVLAWHRHVIGGAVDGGGQAEVESIAVIPSPGGSGEDLWLAVKRYVNGATVRHIEYMGPVFDHLTAQEDGYFVDGGLSYDSAPATIFSGLGHLEGETVKVAADGATHPDCTVSGGQITLNAAASVVHVGLGYTALMETERADVNMPDGTAQARKKRISKVTARLYRSGVFEYGWSEDDMFEIEVQDASGTIGEAPPLLTEDYGLNWNAPWGTDATIILRSAQPVPLTVLALVYDLEATTL